MSNHWHNLSRHQRRRGAMSIEAIIVLGTLVMATFALAKFGYLIMRVFFSDGNHLTGIPIL